MYGRSEYKGIGIGFVVCWCIVEWYNGYIIVKSIFGEGVMFLMIMFKDSDFFLNNNNGDIYNDV